MSDPRLLGIKMHAAGEWMLGVSVRRGAQAAERPRVMAKCQDRAGMQDSRGWGGGRVRKGQGKDIRTER